ncbi:chromosome partitioning protein, ParB family [Desulfonatronum thiosulfatophilum]|uniref:Chromosome partitioning protein, ParB family n=1 Tax=Desulfonatronum thiosulfatophilum TaxID=617002 RepID=A0A1G6B8J5_9BACT|nr:ParB/RepB/Spo0J family partition protein [Desulfonatronum thiosulfatophilum]SDB16975.1 chromosome partitioning protein, ParB family [Desulfonatronum thiosulfatophilum]
MALRGLGRGLGALLGEESQEQGLLSRDSTLISVDALHPNRYQPRKTFSQESLAELASSIRVHGVLQPVIARAGQEDGTYELVAGERRWRASKIAGLVEIPAIIREMSDRESLALALIENVQREDLNAIEQAMALQQLQTEFKATQNDLAERTGLSRSHITNLLRLLQLPDNIQRDIQQNIYTAGHGRALAAITDPEYQNILRKRIVDFGLSVRECEQHAAYWKCNGCFTFQGKQDCVKKSDTQNLLQMKYESVLVKEIGIKKITLRGSEEKGTMSMSYGSREEFERLLTKLGVNGERINS